MPKLRIISYCVSLLLLVAASGRADVIKSGSIQAYSDGVNVTLRWATEDESSVLYYEVERSTGNSGNFMSIGRIDPKGPSLYEFIDNSAFMLKVTTIYHYRIKVVFSGDKTPLYTQSLTVSHTVSGVRRTWGSIKAMFR